MSVKLKKEVLRLTNETPLTLKELAELTDTSDKKMFRIIRSLFKDGKLDSIFVKGGKSKYKSN